MMWKRAWQKQWMCRGFDYTRSKMNNTYTAVVRQDGKWWIGWIEEIPGVNCQEASREELLETLRVTLLEALEFNREEAIAAAGNRYQEELVAV